MGPFLSPLSSQSTCSAVAGAKWPEGSMREGWWRAGAVASLGPVSSSMADCLQTQQEGVCSLSEPFSFAILDILDFL